MPGTGPVSVPTQPTSSSLAVTPTSVAPPFDCTGAAVAPPVAAGPDAPPVVPDCVPLPDTVAAPPVDDCADSEPVPTPVAAFPDEPPDPDDDAAALVAPASARSCDAASWLLTLVPHAAATSAQTTSTIHGLNRRIPTPR